MQPKTTRERKKKKKRLQNKQNLYIITITKLDNNDNIYFKHGEVD